MSARTTSGVRLHIVTGKGGTGKTTVAAALAMALASGPAPGAAQSRSRAARASARPSTCRRWPPRRSGSRELGGRRRGLAACRSTPRPPSSSTSSSSTSSAGPAGCSSGSARSTSRRRSPPACATCCSSARSTRRTGAARAGHHSRHDGHPGLRRDRARRPADRPRRPLPLGQRGGRRPRARWDRSASQADSITRAARRPPQTAVHVVTLLEEMPVQETVERWPSSRAARLRLGDVVVNQVRDPLLGDELALDRRKGTDQPSPRCAAGLEEAGADR